MAKSITAERLYTIKELAELSGIKESYINNARKRYGLKYTMLDTIRISLRDWDAFVAERSIQKGNAS